MMSKHDNLATVLTSDDAYNSLKGIMEIAELILDSLNSILCYMKNYNLILFIRILTRLQQMHFCHLTQTECSKQSHYIM